MDTHLEANEVKEENPEKEANDEEEEIPKVKRRKVKNVQLFCDICNKPMRSRHHLKVHSAVHTGEKNFICQICQKGFQQKWNLITHAARVHSKIKPFKCSDCGKAFGYSSHFKRHVKTHFLEKIEAPDIVKKRILNPHKCEFCEKCFDSHYRLDIHMKKHTGDKPFICDKCGKRFTTKRLIVVHMTKKHDMEVDFLCEHCGKSFPDRSAMLLHLKTGHKICDVIAESIPQRKRRKPSKKEKELIPCEVCGKTINRMTMNKHLNIHYRKRVYKCKYCPKEFLESGQRAIHERRHTGEKPYLCDVCGKGHSQYGNLLTHRKRYHNLTDRPPRLWKRITAPELEADLNSEIEKNESAPLKEKNQLEPLEEIQNPIQRIPETLANSPYTGDETLEEFMKKASTWIDKKFSESKPARRKWAGKRRRPESESEYSDEDDIPLSKIYPAKIEEDCVEDNKHVSDLEDLGQDNNSDVDDLTQDSMPDLEDISQNTILDEQEEKPDIKDIEINAEESELKINEQETIIKEPDSNTNESLSTTKESDPVPNMKEVSKKIHDLIYDKIIEDLVSRTEEDKLKEIVKVTVTISEKKSEKESLTQLLRLLKPIPDNIVTKNIDGKLFWHCWMPMCDSKFRNRHLLTRHLIIHEPEENRPFKCELCHKRFIQSNNYKEHVMSHRNENQYYCEKCGAGFRHKTHLNNHLKRHNPGMSDPRPKNFKCSYCDKKFATSYHKIEHERKHTNERPYLCKTCGSQFRTLSTLNKHMKVHDTAKQQCDICLKWFRHKFSLKRHLRTHSFDVDQRTYCECGVSVSQKSALKRHKFVCKFNDQPLERRYECQICSKKFGGNHDLKRHVETHETERKYKCPICSSRIKTRETYKKHLKRHQKKPTDFDEFSCDQCAYCCVDVKDLTKHIVQIHLSWKY